MRTLTGVHSYTAELLLASVLLVGMAAQTYAGEPASLDIDKLRKAQRLAARVFDETGNAAGAVKVLEEAGITGLVKERVTGIPLKTYAGLLETYGSLLSKLPDRRREAPAILKTVIEIDPERATTYFHLGNLYYELYRQEPLDGYLAVYSSAYRKYVDHLRKHGRQVLLSSSIVDAAYESDGLDICGFTELLQQEGRLADLNLFFNPETEVTNLSKAATGEEGLSAASFTGFISGSIGPIRKSLIDVDNDGHPETWYSAAVMTGDCRRNVFYLHAEGQSTLLSNGLLDNYYRSDRLCSGGRIFFVRYLQQNYLLEQQPLERGAWETTVYRLTPDGDYLQLCNKGN
ncbi:MAG TPA: hypothetical protein VF268_08490 [Gammaproteobacteria bacterium]